MSTANPWRKITKEREAWEEHMSLRSRTFTWRKVRITTVTLECGHKKVYRGDRGTPKKARCSLCPTKEAHA